MRGGNLIFILKSETKKVKPNAKAHILINIDNILTQEQKIW